ncbi:uncharacterized protein LOC113168377 [Anabas testudineus]|uniref:uncharacterized protein LOC113168377 n=1 Tax=Anabas testudineus TaxID=64144 RepID=UPI00143D09E7|nr:uncharacterized protein LOC113168377 [Anabas testudineus]
MFVSAFDEQHESSDKIKKKDPSQCGRVELKDPETKDGDVSVVLKNVNIYDAGTCKCYVGRGRFQRPKRSSPVCFSIITLKVEDQINLTAEPGDTVTLPCGVHSNISIIVVEWSRTDLETEYVFLQRGSRSDPDNQHESFKNRVELKDREKKDGDVSLILRNVTFNDTGTYECRVVQRRTNYRKRSILESDPINTINLRVEPGNNKEDGGDKDGGKSGGHEDRNSRGHVGLAVGLSVTVLVLVLVVAFMFLTKLKRTRQSTNSAPADSSDGS